MRRVLLASLGCCLALAGCQAPSGGMDPREDLAPLSLGAAAMIAGDMANRFSEQFPTAAGTLALPDTPSPFGTALEASLKGSGYAVVSGPKHDSNAIALFYTLDRSEEGVLASLSTRNLRIARLYALSNAGAVPTSPLSVMAVK